MAYYKISDIEGIGPVYAEKLAKAGVKSIRALLIAGATKKGRDEIARKSGLDASLVLKWVNMADLFRIKGIGSEYSELLEKAGVDTVKELRNRKAENLTAKMAEVNSQGKKLVRILPAKVKVERWIKDAAKLEPVIKY
ncbi:MAG: DUF4332 domain-containing protein [Ignavibacteria bacterium]|nr:DUF4332 domain-containing protein [Ignavibacteria bacterium]